MSAGRGAPPAPGEVRPFSLPAVESTEPDSGLALRVARLDRLPVVSAVLVLDAGEVRIPEERAGLAKLTADALDGGTTERSGAELAEALECLGASLSVSAGWDSTTLSLTVLPDRLDAAIDLLAEVVLAPSFPEGEVDRVREQRLATLRQRRDDPASLADDEIAREVFAPHSPYARPRSGLEESIQALGRDDLHAFRKACYRPGGAGLVCTGDVEVQGVSGAASRLLGGWEGEPPPRPPVEAGARTRVRRIVIVDRPGAVQSEIRVGHPGIPRASADQIPLTVFNTVLGGQFTSRLNLKLREERGFTYGVRSRLYSRRDGGLWLVSTAVETEVTATAVGDVIAEITALVDEGPDPDEIDLARDYLVGVFPLRMETSAQVAARIAEVLIYRLPEDYYETYPDRVRAVGLDDAVEAGRRGIRPEEAQILIVGDAARVRSELEALGVGEVAVRNPSS